MNIPRIVIAGTNSGCGKTTVSTGIMGALCKKGLKVQPYKVGPDYIDPMFHTFITRRHSRNLDSWMLDEKTVTHLFVKSGRDADIAVIEGVMGCFDGHGGLTETGSTAHVAKLVNAPVILVINGEGMSLSIVPLVQGFRDFDPKLCIKGIIINNIKSESHYLLLKENIEQHTGISVIGYLKKTPECALPSRHLGLVPGEEIHDLRDKVDLLADQVEKTVDIELLLKIAREAHGIEEIDLMTANQAQCQGEKVKIAVARDKAFNFYYKDNLDLLEMLGAELVFFSPINDTAVPSDADGLYIGGGYPEEWAYLLEANSSMRSSIFGCITEGMPAYAECGGLMYLSQTITGRDEKTYDMVGVIPGKSEMTSRLQRFGYVEIEVACDNVLAQKGSRIKAHEFHYSVTGVTGEAQPCFVVSKKRKPSDTVQWNCGFKRHNLLAGYPHLHFWSNMDFARGFVENCRINKARGEKKYAR